MKIYTKTGDAGTTSLLGGTRVLKSHERIDAYGTIDELNAFVGLLKDQKVNAERADFLKQIQDRLFTIGSALAADPDKANIKHPDITEADIQLLEAAMDEMEVGLPALKNFILPGGHESVSFAHLARTVCRRAERNVIKLAQNEFVSEVIGKYLNRLSDYFFILGRKMALELGVDEVIWNSRNKS
ncbi:cob(I)yrinic acid a,c-diamide adenosyltransferase [Penaeicola halotolerans]|uniref:cob(I)yrinic acid a,c-diamide adenosyltransferase n=1 Tax=Penaeicola halotolerans TaxID=2793196 RepID=UPI001CF90108|nr:cob(I)yrinic acid a,c-diamide adenosyltransferase [Penaeicola halotolerans]